MGNVLAEVLVFQELIIVYILWVVDVYIVVLDLGLGFGERLRTPVRQISYPRIDIADDS